MFKGGRVAVDPPLKLRLIQGWRPRPRRLAGRVPGAPGTGVWRGGAPAGNGPGRLQRREALEPLRSQPAPRLKCDISAQNLIQPLEIGVDTFVLAVPVGPVARMILARALRTLSYSRPRFFAGAAVALLARHGHALVAARGTP